MHSKNTVCTMKIMFIYMLRYTVHLCSCLCKCTTVRNVTVHHTYHIMYVHHVHKAIA
jgi:hypothetical protein